MRIPCNKPTLCRQIMSNLFTHHPNALGKEESFYSWVQGVGERNFALGRWVKNGKAEKPWQKARWSALRRGTWRKGDAERGGMSKAEGVWWSELGQVRWNARLHCELQFAKPCRSADPRTRPLGGRAKPCVSHSQKKLATAGFGDQNRMIASVTSGQCFHGSCLKSKYTIWPLSISLSIWFIHARSDDLGSSIHWSFICIRLPGWDWSRNEMNISQPCSAAVSI